LKRGYISSSNQKSPQIYQTNIKLKQSYNFLQQVFESSYNIATIGKTSLHRVILSHSNRRLKPWHINVTAENFFSNQRILYAQPRD